MKVWHLSVCFGLILISEMVLSSYISWEDLKVEGESLRPQSAAETKRVIVVDQTGKGDCLSVQAAVDLVPHHNPHRLKIYILPGLYRFISFFSTKTHVFNVGSFFFCVVGKAFLHL